ncbi:hypothetical protein M9434_005837 [Picochlorum sp. BPE23]|nr:hypothetical protein M9434_005837 [Picochlorum sp. BPE23]
METPGTQHPVFFSTPDSALEGDGFKDTTDDPMQQQQQQRGGGTRTETEEAIVKAKLTNLRSKLTDVERDNWMYEKPRYTHQ